MTDFRDATYDYGLEPGEAFDPDELEDEAFDMSRPHVMTALGPIDPGALGFTLPHEHLICCPPLSEPDLLLESVVNAASELEGFFATGGRAIVDMTTADYGRNAADVRWIAQHVPVHIVLATGHHKDRFAAPYLGERSIDEISATMIAELTVGIDGVGTMAGVIKAGTSLDEITAVEERVLRAAARAQLATGAPISTDTERGTMAREQIAILQAEGVDPDRVIVGHLDHQLNEAYLLGVLETGAYVAFDQWSKEQYALDMDRADMLKRLVDAGFERKVLISGDFGRQSKLLSYGGGPGYVFFIEQVPLMLMEAGLSAFQVRQLFIENPADALTISRPSA